MSDDVSRVLLKSAQLRVTPARLAILETLRTHHGPFTVDEMLRLKPLRKLDRVTLYRTIEAFATQGLVQHRMLGDGKSRYEFIDPDHHHHHVCCRKCSYIETLYLCIPKAMERKVEALGFVEVQHILEFSGICAACQKKSA
jgi:Fe2+ or Zn2+ uptake regulation protein